MNNFYFNVSTEIPHLPELCNREKNLIINRFDSFENEKKNRGKIQGYFLDYAFIKKNAQDLKKRITLPGSILLWNSNAETEDEIIPSGLIFQEISSLANEKEFVRIIKNMHRSLFLRKEIEKKEAVLKEQEKINKELLNVGIALSSERNNQKLLDFILAKTREITQADAGSLYLLEGNEEAGNQTLLFKIAHNDSNPTDFSEFSMRLDKKSIAGYVAVTSKILNIPDAYRIPKDSEVFFNDSYDKSTGYKTKSILTVPMKDHKEHIIGVIQLINRKKDVSINLSNNKTIEKNVVPFNKENESVVLSLASQAAVSLENNILYQEIETLFEGFVQASIKAIESRDPTTSGHSNRVAQYTVSLAEAVSKTNRGKYKDIKFTGEQIKEIRYASLLHDFGKVGVRENVLVKAKKLYPLQIDVIKMRFDYIYKMIQFEIMKEHFKLLKKKGLKEYLKEKEILDKKETEQLREICNDFKAVSEINEPKVTEDNQRDLIDEIAGKNYMDISGQRCFYLTEDEHELLGIRQGSLNDKEREEIKSHVIHTFEYLKNIPWTTTMKKVPEISRAHHEMLNGTGYPDGKKGEDIPIQSRIMTIADMYDALIASDRPYKRALSDKEALKVLENEAVCFHIDKDLVDIFIKAKIYKKIGKN